ncbi:hypothetical protein D3C73_1319110 [compost metagenome]
MQNEALRRLGMDKIFIDRLRTEQPENQSGGKYDQHVDDSAAKLGQMLDNRHFHRLQSQPSLHNLCKYSVKKKRPYQVLRLIWAPSHS